MNKNDLQNALHGLSEWVLKLLFPPAANCLCCGHPRLASTVDSLCPTCREELEHLYVPPEACDRCLSYIPSGNACPLCNSPFMQDIERVYAPFRYQDAVRSLIHTFKFDICDDAASILAAHMENALVDHDFDCMTPVPMSPKRLAMQGRNHAETLARQLSLETGIPLRLLMQRSSFHRKQSTLRGEKRQSNVAHAFSMAQDEAGKPLRADGLRILLIDDVRTTGSTAAACAKVLKENGAASVSLCVAAVVYSRHPGGK